MNELGKFKTTVTDEEMEKDNGMIDKSNIKEHLPAIKAQCRVLNEKYYIFRCNLEGTKFVNSFTNVHLAANYVEEFSMLDNSVFVITDTIGEVIFVYENGKMSEYKKPNSVKENSIVFSAGPNNVEVLRLCDNGDMFVKGRLTDNDIEVVNTLKELIKDRNEKRKEEIEKDNV